MIWFGATIWVVIFLMSTVLLALMVVPILSIVLRNSRLGSMRVLPIVVILMIVVIYLRIIHIVDSFVFGLVMGLCILSNALNPKVSKISSSMEVSYLMIVVSVLIGTVLMM